MMSRANAFSQKLHENQLGVVHNDIISPLNRVLVPMQFP